MVLGNFIIITALIMQLRDRADRQTQRDNETVRSTKAAMTEGLNQGHTIFLDMLHEQQHQLEHKDESDPCDTYDPDQ